MTVAAMLLGPIEPAVAQTDGTVPFSSANEWAATAMHGGAWDLYVDNAQGDSFSLSCTSNDGAVPLRISSAQWITTRARLPDDGIAVTITIDGVSRRFAFDPPEISPPQSQVSVLQLTDRCMRCMQQLTNLVAGIRAGRSMTLSIDKDRKSVV